MKPIILPIQKRPLQYSATVSGLLVTLSCGLHVGWTSPYLPILTDNNSPIPMTLYQSSWVGPTYMLGGVCGSVLLSVICRLIGRKSILLWSSIPFCISWILIGFGTTLPILLVGRYTAGVTEGMALASLQMYISEISDKEIRGFLLSASSVAFFTGILLINLIGSCMTVRSSSLVCLTVAVLFFVTFIWMPESPNYLLMKAEKEKARRNFIALKGVEDSDRKLEVIKEVIEKENLNQAQFSSLFKKNNRGILTAMFGLRLAQQFSGIVAFTFNAQTIFKESGAGMSPHIGVVIFHLLQVVFSLLSTSLVDRVGRKPLLIVSTVGVIGMLIGGGSFFFIQDVVKVDTSRFSILPTVILFVFTICYSLGLHTMPNFITAELFPTNLKAYASTVSSVTLYGCGALTTKYFQITKDSYGLFLPFWSFAICCTVGLVIIVIFLLETRNKTLEDIQMELNK